MLRITIDLIPLGNKERQRCLGIAEIANDGTGTKQMGNYKYRILKRNSTSTWKSGHITNFPRKKLGPWDLVYRVLVDAMAERNEN